MVDKVFENISDAAKRYEGNMRSAIDYGLFQKRLMDRARTGAPDYSPDEWFGLKDFVTDDFAGLHSFLLNGQIFPAFGDVDGDFDMDMILGLDDGHLMYFMNMAGPGVPVSFANPVYLYMSIDVGQASTPQLIDLNKDGLLDMMLTSTFDNTLRVFINQSTSGNISFKTPSSFD